MAANFMKKYFGPEQQTKLKIAAMVEGLVRTGMSREQAKILAEQKFRKQAPILPEQAPVQAGLFGEGVQTYVIVGGIVAFGLWFLFREQKR